MKAYSCNFLHLIIRNVLALTAILQFTNPAISQTQANVHSVLIPYCCENDKWGFCDENLNVVIPCTYDWAEPFYNGLAKVKVKSKVGCINMQGEEIIRPEYDQIDWVNKKVLKIKKESGIGEDGDRLFATLYSYGLMDIDGNTLSPIKYDKIDDFTEGLAPVKVGTKWGFINLQGKEAVPLKYDEVLPFHEGLAAVRRDKKWGFVDTTGKEVIKCKFDNAAPFQEGLSAVSQNYRFGYIDKTGKEVIPLQYRWA